MPMKTDIRNAVRDLLKPIPDFTIITTGRRRSIPAADLPAVCIYVDNEQIELFSTGHPRQFNRRLTIATEIHLQDQTAEALETQLDRLTNLREDAILSDETLGGLVAQNLPESIEYRLVEEGHRPAAVAICRDQALYFE